MREEARRLVLPGFTTLDDARTAIVELVEDDEELGVAPERAQEILHEVWTARVAEQGRWRGLSDADRFASAFSELEANGVVARMSFTCCGSCGAAEIADEVPPGAQARGYVFFHRQDADGLTEPHPALYLSYGAFLDDGAGRDEYQRAALDIGRLVKRTLEANGLTVHWSGNLAARIGVEAVDWRRPLPTP